MRFPNSHWTTAYPMVFEKNKKLHRMKLGLQKRLIFASILFNKYNVRYLKKDSPFDNGQSTLIKLTLTKMISSGQNMNKQLFKCPRK